MNHNTITTDSVGSLLFRVSYGTQSYMTLAPNPTEAIKKVVKEMAIGRWRLVDVKTYENEDGSPEVYGRARGKFANFPIYCVPQPIIR